MVKVMRDGVDLDAVNVQGNEGEGWGVVARFAVRMGFVAHQYVSKGAAERAAEELRARLAIVEEPEGHDVVVLEWYEETASF